MPDMPHLSQNQDEVLQNLRDWLTKALKKIEEKIAKKSKRGTEEAHPPIVMSWTDPDGQEKVVYEMDAEEMQELAGTLPIAERLYATAFRDALALREKQTYFVTIEKAPGRFPMVFGDDGDDDFDDVEGGAPGDAAEPEGDEPDEPGDRGMSFRGGGGAGFGGIPGQGRVPIYDFVEWAKMRTEHERFLVKEGRLERENMFRMMRTVIQEQSETIQSYNKSHAQSRVELEELVSQKHVRDLEHKKLQLTEERKEKAFQMLEPFGRAMAVKLMGPAAMAGDGSQTMARLFESVFSSLTPEQFQKLQTIMSPDQIQHLTELFMTMQNLEEQRKAQSDKVTAHTNGVGMNGSANGHANGHANGAGNGSGNGAMNAPGPSGVSVRIPKSLHPEDAESPASKQ